jgi:RHS repeat-associated protein
MVGSTGTIYWRGLDGEIANETDASNVILHRHVFFDGRRVSRTDNQPSWSAHFYFSDFLGSANVVTNATGGIEDESDYYPYGGERVISNVVPQNYKFTAKERDAESGLDEFGARYYANAMGRFMTPDWSEAPVAVPYAVLGNPQTLNLYSYVENNPATGTDPDGHAGGNDINPFQGDASGLYDCLHSGGSCDGKDQTQKAQPVPQPPPAQDKATTMPLPLPFPGIPDLGRLITTVVADVVTTANVTVAATVGYLLSPPGKFAKDTIDSSGPKAADNTPRSDLPRDKAGNYVPHPEAQGPHTALGTRTGHDGVPYTQGATFGSAGEFAGRTDVTSHGRGDHANPHFHPATGPASVGPAEAIPED